jgi:uncharacterized protein YcbX
MTPILTEIWRYPVKGLGGERLERVDLSRARGLPADRRFALAPESSGFDRAAPGWLPKREFLQLAKDAGMWNLRAAWQDDGETLTLEAWNGSSLSTAADDPEAASRIEAFVAEMAGPARRAGASLVQVPGVSFSDTGRILLSIIALPSLRAIRGVAGVPIDPRRFRGNLLIDGGEAWAELGWIGREIGIGNARVRVVEPIGRCAATTVNPESGERDLDIPKLLARHFGHVICGVYAEIIADGEISNGAELRFV